MTQLKKTAKSHIIKTTIGHLIEAFYDAAYDEFKNEDIAHRIALQMLIKKLRQEKNYFVFSTR